MRLLNAILECPVIHMNYALLSCFKTALSNQVKTIRLRALLLEDAIENAQRAQCTGSLHGPDQLFSPQVAVENVITGDVGAGDAGWGLPLLFTNATSRGIHEKQR